MWGFNTVVDRGLDRSGSDPLDTSRDSSVALSHLLHSCCVVDTWRSLHPGVRVFTSLTISYSLLYRNASKQKTK